MQSNGSTAPVRNIIGPRLRQARAASDPPMTMDQLSHTIVRQQNLDISPHIIAKIETGTRLAADYEVASFALALNLRADWLLGLTDDKTP